jgi:hypothetical protein
VALVWPSSRCGPFSLFKKGGWWKVASGTKFELLPGDLTQLYAPGGFFPMGGFYAEGAGNTWQGFVGTPNALITQAAFTQCFDDTTNCTQAVEMGMLPFNTAPDLTVDLLDNVAPGDPNWIVY